MGTLNHLRSTLKLRTSGFTVSTKTETQLLKIGNMKTLFAIFALFLVSCYAAPAPADKSINRVDKTPEPVIILPEKGEAPIKEEPPIGKGEENAHNAVKEDETEGEFWIPFWDTFSGWFSKKEELPSSNNEVKMAKPAPVLKKPQRADFDDSHEFLEELNTYHFGPEESRELVNVEDQEARYAVRRTPEHVKDAELYGKVMPRKEDYDDYGEYLSKSSDHIMAPEVQKTKPKSTWYSWFKFGLWR